MSKYTATTFPRAVGHQNSQAWVSPLSQIVSNKYTTPYTHARTCAHPPRHMHAHACTHTGVHHTIGFNNTGIRYMSNPHYIIFSKYFFVSFIYIITQQTQASKEAKLLTAHAG